MKGSAMVSGLEMLRAEEKQLEERLTQVKAQIAKKTVTKRSGGKNEKGEEKPSEIVEGQEAKRSRLEKMLNVNDRTSLASLKKWLGDKVSTGKPDAQLVPGKLGQELE